MVLICFFKSDYKFINYLVLQYAKLSVMISLIATTKELRGPVLRSSRYV